MESGGSSIAAIPAFAPAYDYRSRLFSHVRLKSRVPRKHPLRKMREMVDEALEGMSADFDEMYSRMGRVTFRDSISRRR